MRTKWHGWVNWFGGVLFASCLINMLPGTTIYLCGVGLAGTLVGIIMEVKAINHE